MPNLSQVELQNLRHFIGAHETSYQKLNTYASQAVDPQIKQMFTKAAQDSLNTKQKLIHQRNTFLNRLHCYMCQNNLTIDKLFCNANNL